MKKRKDLQRMSAVMMKVKSPLKNGEGLLTSPEDLKKQNASKIGTGKIKVKLGKNKFTGEKKWTKKVTNIPFDKFIK